MLSPPRPLCVTPRCYDRGGVTLKAHPLYNQRGAERAPPLAAAACSTFGSVTIDAKGRPVVSTRASPRRTPAAVGSAKPERSDGCRSAREPTRCWTRVRRSGRVWSRIFQGENRFLQWSSVVENISGGESISPVVEWLNKGLMTKSGALLAYRWGDASFPRTARELGRGTSQVPAARSPCITTDQSDAGSVVIFSQQTNQTQEVWVYSRHACGPRIWNSKAS